MGEHMYTQPHTCTWIRKGERSNLLQCCNENKGPPGWVLIIVGNLVLDTVFVGLQVETFWLMRHSSGLLESFTSVKY